MECPRAGAWQTWSLQARRPRFGSRVSTKKRAKNSKPFWCPLGPRGKRSPRKRNAARFFGGKFWEPTTTTTTTIPGSALTRQSRVPSPGTPSTRRRGKREGCAADRPGAPDEEEEKVLKGRLRTRTRATPQHLVLNWHGNCRNYIVNVVFLGWQRTARLRVLRLRRRGVAPGVRRPKYAHLFFLSNGGLPHRGGQV